MPAQQSQLLGSCESTNQFDGNPVWQEFSGSLQCRASLRLVVIRHEQSPRWLAAELFEGSPPKCAHEFDAPKILGPKNKRTQPVPRVRPSSQPKMNFDRVLPITQRKLTPNYFPERPGSQTRHQVGRAYSHRIPLANLKCASEKRRWESASRPGETERQDEQAPAALLAGLLEFSGELAVAIDLHGSDGVQHPLLEAVEELRGGGSGRTRVRLQHVPARDDIARGELFPDHAGQRSSVSTWTRSPGWRARYFLDFLTAQRRGGSEPRGSTISSHVGKAAARAQDLIGSLLRPSRLPPAIGTMLSALRGVEVLRIEASPPAVEGLAANVETAAGQSCIPPPVP